MTQIPVQLLMPFETLIETIRSLDIEDQLRLQRLLNQEIDRRTAQSPDTDHHCSGWERRAGEV